MGIGVGTSVIVVEKTNARYVEVLDEPIALAVIDVSFISKAHFAGCQKWLTADADVVAPHQTP